MSRAKSDGPNLTAASRLSAFLNVPYDDAIQHLYLAYIAGLAAKGLPPRATLEIPGGVRRLDRIPELIAACRYSFHDLSSLKWTPGARLCPGSTWRSNWASSRRGSVCILKANMFGLCSSRRSAAY